MVVAFNFERDRPALADVDHAGVFTHANHEVLGHFRGDLLTELAEVDLGGFVGAVLRPHHRIHG